MKTRSKLFNGLLLAGCAVVAIVGIFQLGHLIGYTITSDSFSLNMINLTQVGLICSGVWATYMFIKTIKKLTVSPLSN